MKLEVGQKYKACTPEGVCRVFIILGQHPVSKLFLASHDESEYIFVFNEDWQGVNCSFNIIEEYKEPRVGYLNVYDDEFPINCSPIHVYHDTRKDADGAVLSSRKRIACIKIVEGQFDE